MERRHPHRSPPVPAHADPVASDVFRRFLEGVPLPSWMTAADGTACPVNEAWREFTGRGASELPVTAAFDTVIAEGRPVLEKAIVGAMASQTPFQIEMRLRRADGVPDHHRAARAHAAVDAHRHLAGA